MDPPIKPNESDCCNSGCNPCILDVYEEQLKLYKPKKSNRSKIYHNCISPTSYTIFEASNVERQSKDTFLYTFKYLQPLRGDKNKDLSLQYNPGQHFLLKADANGEEFTRAYTPIPTTFNDTLHFTTLIKLYKNGKMSDYLKTIKIGNRTLWRGPYGKFKIDYNLKCLFLVAQGTGIAPIYSIVADMINNENCVTFLKLFYCCRDSENIYLRGQLYNLSSNWNFTYEVFLSESIDNLAVRYNETIHNRRMEFSDIQNYLLDKCETTNVVICGSDIFMDSIKKHVLSCRIEEESVFTF